MGEPNISGQVVLQNIDVARERFGSAVADEALDALSAEQRDAVDAALAISWLPYTTMEAFFSALGHALHRSAGDVHREVSTESVERNFRTVWRVLLRFTTDDALVRRAPVIWKRACDTGELVGRIVEPGRAQLELSGFPGGAPEFFVRVLEIAPPVALAKAGRKNVRSRARRTADGAEVEVTFDR